MPVPFRDAEDHYDEMARQVEAEYDASLVMAAGQDVFVDLKGNGPLAKMLDAARRRMVADIDNLVRVDAGNVAEIRRIQTSIEVYKSLVGFALEALRATSAVEVDSGEDLSDELLPGNDEDAEAFIERLGAGEPNAEG